VNKLKYVDDNIPSGVRDPSPPPYTCTREKKS